MASISTTAGVTKGRGKAFMRLVSLVVPLTLVVGACVYTAKPTISPYLNTSKSRIPGSATISFIGNLDALIGTVSNKSALTCVAHTYKFNMREEFIEALRAFFESKFDGSLALNAAPKKDDFNIVIRIRSFNARLDHTNEAATFMVGFFAGMPGMGAVAEMGLEVSVTKGTRVIAEESIQVESIYQTGFLTCNGFDDGIRQVLEKISKKVISEIDGRVIARLTGDLTTKRTSIPVIQNDPEKSLRKAKDLLDKGLITKQEYENKRKEILKSF